MGFPKIEDDDNYIVEGELSDWHCAGADEIETPYSEVTILGTDDQGRVNISIYGKRKVVAQKSLFCLPAEGFLRKTLIKAVESKWCDRLILSCIVINSVLLALEKHRAPSDDPTNVMVALISNILSAIFLIECVFKIISWGYCLYMRDPWNVLDFVVVVSAVVEWIPGIPFGGLGFLRLFRVLRPLRSLNSVPEMKLLVNTSVGAVPRLGNVAALGVFLFMVLAIIGLTLLPGIFYRECHTTPQPELTYKSKEDIWCWKWPKVGDGALCGGNYMCTVTENGHEIRHGYCGGHEFDMGDFRPKFVSAKTSLGPAQGGPFDWCSDNDRPMKVAPELDFVHFDHLPGAFLLIFQCMTMEGWTDLMYYVKDAYSFPFAVAYFFMLIIITSHFLLNVALAVVDEVREDFDNEEDEAEGEEGEEKEKPEEDDQEEDSPWADHPYVHQCRWITSLAIWQNFIMLIITGNVVTMCMAKFPPDPVQMEILQIVGYVFLFIFVVELVVELIARGPRGYVTNKSTAFDGFVVIVSIFEIVMKLATGGKGGGALQALRTLRLFRVLNKFASRNPKFKILLKSMVGTAKALRYWLVLFLLVLYICTLMWMHFFANTLQFDEPDDSAGFIGRYDDAEVSPKLQPWCEIDTDSPLARRRTSWHYRQDCIPRAHYDNFGWGFVTVFQIMTGENWNAIMYAGMRATRDSNWEWAFGILYVILLLFGQTLFLSLFLSMLLSTFDEFRSAMEEEEREKAEKAERAAKAAKLAKTRSMSMASVDADGMPREGEENLEDPNDLQGQLPGQLVEISPGRDTLKRVSSYSLPPSKSQAMEDEDDLDLQLAELDDEKPWPYGYSWFCCSDEFPTRFIANEILSFTIDVNGTDVNVFDSFILASILVSTLCMMVDYPLADPTDPLISTVRVLDKVFAVIFILEMAVKLMAWPLVWGENAYFWSPGCGWNWLDAIVVSVSIMGFAGDGPKELKTLRILRAFRPLRVVKRAQNLKNIVEAIFNSMKELGVLLIVFLLFLLIFALVFMMYLSGTLYACSESNVWFHRDVGDMDFNTFTMPLCLSNQNGTIESAKMRGKWNETREQWSIDATECGNGVLGGFDIPWARATADTPICVGRCDSLWRAPFNSTYAAPPDLCPPKYTMTEELPHKCSDDVAALPGRNTFNGSEEVGNTYIEAMQQSYAIPCGGTTVDTVGTDDIPAAANSCRARFCPVVERVLEHSCKRAAELHPYFCVEACSDDDKSAKCRSCREEVVAACECPNFCTPLIKDAALCVEQGGSWEQVLSHNFDNVFNSMLTLVEISTTEGWVDAMYAACDTDVMPYVQPLRDTSHPLWMFMFVLWILFSFMFLMNLGVGIIVDKFMEMREDGKDYINPAVMKWVRSSVNLLSRKSIYPITHLHQLPPRRRQVYDIVEHPYFERSIMACIVFNTVLMATVTFPELETDDVEWWSTLKIVINYLFGIVFTVEAGMKIFALGNNFWNDFWNKFDLMCVVATIAGIILKEANTGINISSVASVIRIFRIARLFRLLKFKALRPLNKLFMALAISLVKLASVGVVAFLFLVLFSILGVSLFSTVSQESDTHDGHGNFAHFLNAFITLFRASTGEAWNEIMHDLHKDESDWFRAGDWCTPADLFDTTDKYDVLKEKCLIDYPNACVITMLGGWSPMPWLYWITYTLFIGLVIMNVVVAVILEGYEETKSMDEDAIIDVCTQLWDRKYDPDRRMQVIFGDAMCFVIEAVEMLQDEGLVGGIQPRCVGAKISTLGGEKSQEGNEGIGGIDFGTFPMAYAKAFDLPPTDTVPFHTAIAQVLRLCTLVENEEKDQDVIRELDQTGSAGQAANKQIEKLKVLQAKRSSVNEGLPLSQHIAAMKLQRFIRCVIAKLRARNKRHMMLNQDQSVSLKATKMGKKDYLRWTAAANDVAEPVGLTPPISG